MDRFHQISAEIIRLYRQQLNLWVLGKIADLQDCLAVDSGRRMLPLLPVHKADCFPASCWYQSEVPALAASPSRCAGPRYAGLAVCRQTPRDQMKRILLWVCHGRHPQQRALSRWASACPLANGTDWLARQKFRRKLLRRMKPLVPSSLANCRRYTPRWV